MIEVVAFLETLGVKVWLDGGWGVDALLAYQTRPHGDLDLVVSLDEMRKVQDGLTRRGYRLVHGGAPMSFTMSDDGGRRVDVHSVVFMPSGDGLFKMDNGGEWVCPGWGFEGFGRVLGRRFDCLTPEAKVKRMSRSGYEPDSVHLKDVASLSERFGISVPGGFDGR